MKIALGIWTMKTGIILLDRSELELSEFKITVTDGQEPQTDTTAPELNALSFSGTENLTEIVASSSNSGETDMYTSTTMHQISVQV